jgi:hypothetical protein
MIRGEFYSETIIITKSQMAMKEVGFPNSENASEAPTEGRNSKLSKLGGQNFLINWRPKASLFVS